MHDVDDCGRLRVTKAALALVRDQHIAALEVTYFPEPAKGSEPDVAAIEHDLSRGAAAFLESQLGPAGSTIRWVGRYLLDDAIANWTSDRTQVVPLHVGEYHAAGLPELHVGWGNGMILGWSKLDEQDRNQVVRGIVDAQCIWSECYRTASTALERVRELQVPATQRVHAGELLRLQRDCETMSAQWVDHQLSYDDLLLNVQGVRSEVACAALSAWGYAGVWARVDRRVNDALRLLQLKRERFERRFQSTVEYILFAIGLLALVDLSLSLIATSFAGPVQHSPGSESSTGIFEWVRSTNADFVLLTAIAVATVAAIVVERRRRS